MTDTREKERIEFEKELDGVMLRLGYINSNGGKDLCFTPCLLEQPIAWELGIQPDSDLAILLAQFKAYLDRKGNEQLH